MQTNENMEVTSALQSEQHVKKELAKKLGQLQEKLGELKETVSNRRWEGRAGTQWCLQTAGSFPDFDGRVEIGIVMIKLGAFPVVCCLMWGTSMWGQMVAACLVGGFGAMLTVWIMSHGSASLAGMV